MYKTKMQHNGIGMEYHLAQVNIARMNADIEVPIMSEFVQRLDEINAFGKEVLAVYGNMDLPSLSMQRVRAHELAFSQARAIRLQ